MSKYFFDTEFIEGFKKPISWLPTIGSFNKPYHSIQLISIGIVCEDGREYYAISNEFNPYDASDWVKDNVLKPMFSEFCQREEYAKRHHPELLTFKNFLKWKGKANVTIANEIVNFVHGYKDMGDWVGFGDEYFKYLRGTEPQDAPEFYAYYADYDWVLFCSLFGTMMDLPKGFPMYCKDLKQTFDEKQFMWVNNSESYRFMMCRAMFLAGKPMYAVEVDLKKLDCYPTQENEHNALADAKWNFELYKFINTL